MSGVQHLVKCKYCNIQFDANVTEFVKEKNRYAHKTCYEAHQANMSQEDKDLEALNEYIKIKFGKEANWALIKKQIKNYKEENQYTYSGMLKTLIYWYDILHNSTDKANGAIGIVPFIYQQALDYYYNLYLAHLVNESNDNYSIPQKEITIKIPMREKKKIRLFNLDEAEEEK